MCYKQLSSRDLCNCEYCQKYIREIKTTYSKVSEYLFPFGVDIEKPLETIPLETDEKGNIEYLSAQYIVWGKSKDFVKTTIESVTVDIAKSHPETQIGVEHFVIEIYPIELKWVM